MWRNVQTRTPAARSTRSHRLRVGFVPLCDCAPLAVAQEAGLFQKHGLEVELMREVGWASVRDKIAYGQLEAAHALAAMPFAATLGIGSAACDCLTGLILNRQGNAVCLALRYLQEGVRDSKTFGDVIRRRKRSEPLIFGIVSPVSTHRLLMERWLSDAGLVVEKDYEFAVVPPPQLPDLVRAGHLSGFCVGEPWNSVAIDKGLVWSPATSVDIASRHIEKVLFVTDRFARERHDEHLRLIASMLEACQICADPANHEEIACLLSQRHYVNAPAQLIRRSFTGAFLRGPGSPQNPQPFTIYHDDGCNEPTLELGAWVLEHLLPDAGPRESMQRDDFVHKVFRSDLFQAARGLLPAAAPVENHELETIYA